MATRNDITGFAALLPLTVFLFFALPQDVLAQVRGSVKGGERRQVYDGKFPKPFSICSNKTHGNMIITHDGTKTTLTPGKCTSFEAKNVSVYAEPDRRPKSQPKRRCYEKYTYSSGKGSGGMGRVNRTKQCN